MSQKYYRLKQPLFGWEADWADKARNYREQILTYDVLYNLLFKPSDMTEKDIEYNAKVVLEHLGSNIEHMISSEIFDTTPDAQLSFNFEEAVDESL
jgi:hypothetical protein